VRALTEQKRGLPISASKAFRNEGAHALNGEGEEFGIHGARRLLLRNSYPRRRTMTHASSDAPGIATVVRSMV